MNALHIEPTQQTRSDEQRAHFTQAHIDIAVLKVVVETQAKEVARMAEALDSLNGELVLMNKTLSEAKGGWRVLAAVAGAAGLVGSAMSWLLAHMPVRP